MTSSDHEPNAGLTMGAAGALAIDAAAVLVFAVAGRSSHDSAGNFGSILGVAGPFLIGLVATWLLWSAARSRPLAVTTGLVLAFGTVAIGMVLRRFAWDRSTATSFVVVTSLVLGGFIVGWRALWGTAWRRRV